MHTNISCQNDAEAKNGVQVFHEVEDETAYRYPPEPSNVSESLMKFQLIVNHK